MNRYIVEIVEAKTFSIASGHRLDVSESESLLRLLEIDPSEAPDIDNLELEDSDLCGLERAYGLSLPKLADGHIALIRRRVPLDDLPYTVHTGRELPLMLAGTKPLSVFSEYLSSHQTLLEAHGTKFEPHVKAGLIVRRAHRHDDVNYLYFALPQEQWWIDAYLLMLKASKAVGWNDGFERMQGLLLGYKETEMDAYFERIWRRSRF